MLICATSGCVSKSIAVRNGTEVVLAKDTKAIVWAPNDKCELQKVELVLPAGSLAKLSSTSATIEQAKESIQRDNK